jgi:hypothetical protein
MNVGHRNGCATITLVEGPSSSDQCPPRYLAFQSHADLQDKNWRQGSDGDRYIAWLLVLEVAEPNFDNAGKFSDRYVQPRIIAHTHAAALHDPACFLHRRSLTVVQVRHHLYQLRRDQMGGGHRV